MVDRGTFNFTNNLAIVDERIRAIQVPITKNDVLPEGWTPSPWSVLCGRGKDCFEAIGNRRFRLLVEMNLEKYASAKSKLTKSIIVMSVLDEIRDGSGNQIGGFVKFDAKTKRWVDVGDEQAREKVGQQLRVSLAQRKNKNNKSKSTTTAEQGKRVSKSKMVTKKRRSSTCSPSSSSSSSSSSVQPIIVESQNVLTTSKTQKKDIIVRSVSPEPVSSSIIDSNYVNEEKELDMTPTPLLDDIANVLDFELDCDEDELLHIIAVTA